MKIGIYYGSTTGTAQSAAEQIRDALGGEVEVCASIGGASMEELLSCDLLVLGSSTWGCGELQDDWAAALPELRKLDLSGKTVALFGVGDQSGWGDTFVDAMGILYETVKACGANVVGAWPTDGYGHSASRAVMGGMFVGLALDDTNQAAKTPERIAAWVGLLR